MSPADPAGRPTRVLVTGCPRSGTTWAGRVFATAQRAIYLHEPFNRDSVWSSAILPPNNFLYLDDENGAVYADAVGRLLRLEPRPAPPWAPEATQACRDEIQAACDRWSVSHDQLVPVMKDPMALLSAEWLVRRFHLQPVVTVRHPVAVAKSHLRLGWAVGRPLRFLANQPGAQREYFADTAEALLAAAAAVEDVVHGTCLYVRALLLAIVEMHRRNPEWAVLSYERLADEPAPVFERLFATFGLETDLGGAALLNETGSYQEGVVAQTTISPIPIDWYRMWAADEHADDWRGLYERYFEDLDDAFGDVTEWSRSM